MRARFCGLAIRLSRADDHKEEVDRRQRPRQLRGRGRDYQGAADWTPVRRRSTYREQQPGSDHGLLWP